MIATLALLGAHLGATYALLDELDPALVAVDAALALVALLAIFVHLARLTRQRRLHAVVDRLAGAFSVARSIEETAGAGVSLLVASGVADAALLAVNRSQPDGEAGAGAEVTVTAPVATAGYPGGEPDLPAVPQGDGSAARPALARERADSDAWLAPLAEVLGERPRVARVPVVRGDEQLGVLLLVARRKGPLGDPALLEAVGTLFTAALDHARLYQAAFDHARELEKLDSRRREFLYAIAHELRTPLTSIQAFAELLTEDSRSLNGQAARLAGSLANGVDRLAVLVDDLLELGRVEESEVRVEAGTVDVVDALRTAESILRPSFMQRAQSLTMELPEEPVLAVADARSLDQVLVNLLSNANRHTAPRGAVTVRALRAGDVVRVEIDDSGPGIEPQDRRRIFEPFYRVQRQGAASVPGSGLGLAVAKRFTELQGGRIWVEDAPGGGSRFCVQFAAAGVEAAAAAPEEAQPGVR